MTPRRDRRLVNEASRLRAAFVASQAVDIQPIGWDPFEGYRILFAVPGVVLAGGTQPVVSNQHTVRLELGPDYPRAAPVVVAETPVFHPNLGSVVGEPVVLDHEWTAGCSLVEVVTRIGEMLQYKAFDLREPTNLVAAAWARGNDAIFPIGNIDVEAQTRADPAIEPMSLRAYPSGH